MTSPDLQSIRNTGGSDLDDRRHAADAVVWALSAASLTAIPWSLNLAGKLAAVLSLAGWLGIWFKRKPFSATGRAHRQLAWAWALGCVAYLLLHLIHADIPADWRRLEAPSRVMALSGLVFVPMLFHVRLHTLRWPLAIAGLCFGGITLTQFALHPNHRSFGFYAYENMMGFATMGNALMLPAAMGADHGWRKAVMVLGLVGSLTAVVLSGTRGAWPGVLPLAWLLWTTRTRTAADSSFRSAPTLMWRTLSWAVALALAVAVAAPLKQRIEEAGADVAHIRTGDLGGSVGLRLMMSRLALDMIQAHPWAGNGLSEFNQHIVRWADESNIPAAAMERGFQNPHNQYLHWAQSLGLPAASACLLLIVMLPARLAWSSGTGDQEAQRAFRALALTVPLYFMSEAVLDRHHGAQWLCLVYGLLLGMNLRPLRQPSRTSSPGA